MNSLCERSGGCLRTCDKWRASGRVGHCSGRASGVRRMTYVLDAQMGRNPDEERDVEGVRSAD